jgi:hypothetical protein
MAVAVYVLCTLTSALCAVLLTRQFATTRNRLLLWSALSFWAMTLGNALVFIDLVVLPAVDLSVLRAFAIFLAAALLLYGLVGEGA